MPETTTDAIWVEKYRPRSLAEMVGQEGVVPLLRAYAARRSMPHLLFAGAPGTGKTTAALALAHDLLGDDWRDNFLELNASDERGIDTVRTTIKGYARSAPIGGVGFKLLFLDEADNLTSEAQGSLRRMMERYSAACRFILSCNYSSRIIEPIQSRCAVFRFRGMSAEQMRRQLSRVAEGESIPVDGDAYDAIYEQSEGDLRRATNLLQLAAAPGSRVTRKAVEGATTQPIRAEVESMVGLALAGRFFDARDSLFRLFVDRGASGEDILRAVHRFLPELPETTIAVREKIALIDHLAEVDFRLAQGANERVQMESILARLALLRTGPAPRPA